MEHSELKNLLEKRSVLMESIRRFFVSKRYLEVETPILVKSPGTEPNLSPFETELTGLDGAHPNRGDCQAARPATLITSPEYSMKKLLGQGLRQIFTLTKVFRNSEPLPEEGTKIHNPEFTMLEWYRQGIGYRQGMKETEELIQALLPLFNRKSEEIDFSKIHLPTKFKELTDLDMNTATRQDLQKACQNLKIYFHESDSWSDLFYRIFISKIESQITNHTESLEHRPTGRALLKENGRQALHGVFVYDYPKQQAALARVNEGGYAERFELYLNGIELCNAFTELTDANEQRQRFAHEIKERREQGKPIFPIDEDMLRLLPSIQTPTFGNALGIDRLLMVLMDKSSIEEVLPFPVTNLFSDEVTK